MISIVTSTFNSSKYIELFFKKIENQLKIINQQYEIIVVDDGSTDNTVEILKEYSAKNNQFKIIELSNNFGQIAAIFCGLKHCNGDQVFITDSDIEESEDNLVRFYNEYMKDRSFDMIYGVINNRDGYSFKSKLLTKIFNNIIYIITNKKIDKDQSWTRIISKRLAEALLKFKEVESYPAGLFNLVGFKQKKMSINKKYKGYSSYSFLKKLKLALNIFTNFSSFPLIFICLLGLTVSIVSFVFIIIIFFAKLFVGFSSGWASLIIFIGFIGGINILSIGIVGIYVSRIFNQVKERPQYIIKEKINFK